MKSLGPDEGMNALRHPDCRFCTEYERLLKGERSQLAQCYRLTGSDPDGDSDAHLARHAVQAVKELREEADRAGEWEERAFKAEARAVDLEAQWDEHQRRSDAARKSHRKRRSATPPSSGGK